VLALVRTEKERPTLGIGVKPMRKVDPAPKRLLLGFSYSIVGTSAACVAAVGSARSNCALAVRPLGAVNITVDEHSAVHCYVPQ
jgi:hypothetical protein